MAFDVQSTDATTNWNVEEGLSLKDEALCILFESADGCISAEPFDDVFAELIWFVEVGRLPQEIEPNMTIHQKGR